MRILIFSASIGEGHDLPARVLAEGIAEEDPGAEVEIVDSLGLVNTFVRRAVLDSSRFHSAWGNRIFDVMYKLITDVRPTRWVAGKLAELLVARPIRRAVEQRNPDVVVSTYPGSTEMLGRLRGQGKLSVPVVSAITDLAALRYWANPDVSLHLIIHPESAEEVREIAPESEIACVRGLTSPEFYAPRDQAEARRALDLPAEGPVVIVSGGGWAVGDLEGAAEQTLSVPEATVVCLCGRNDELREQLDHRYADQPRVLVRGFTDQMPEWFAAADVLVHSTAGLTVLEAIMRGCRVVSYGWGRGHIRANNEAYVRFRLAEVAATRAELGPALERSLARDRTPDVSFETLPSAASEVLSLARRD